MASGNGSWTYLLMRLFDGGQRPVIIAQEGPLYLPPQ